MELLIGAAIYALIIQKMWTAARTDHELAKQGKVSPRLEAKYGSAAAARAKVDRYGFTDFLRDAYRDFWDRRGEALVAARNAPPAAPGRKVRWRDRLSAAKTVITSTAKKVTGSRVVRKLVDPVELKPKRGPAPEPDVPDPYPLGDPAAESPRKYSIYVDDEPEPARTTQKAQPSTTGGTMTEPTGEATNFNSAIAEIDKLIRLLQVQYDQATVAMRAINAVDAAIDGFQLRQKQIAAAARSLADHLAALNLDSASLGPVLEAAEVLSANDVGEMLEHLEQLRAKVQKVISSCDAAIGALNAARASIVGKYADAANTVEEHLGGDSRFLSGGDAPSSATPATAGAS